MTDTPTDANGQAGEALLPRDLSEFLLELSIGVHRHAIYPPGHPSLLPVVDNIVVRLGEIFQHRRSLSIGIARDRLVVEGAATDPRHPVLGDLARRLHAHHLGALAFLRGVGLGEVQAVLRSLSPDAEREGGEPLGLLPRESIPSWEHVRIYPLGYDTLELTDGEAAAEREPEPATDLWIAMARAAMAGDPSADPQEFSDPGSVARCIRAHAREAEYDRMIVRYLVQLAEELRSGKTGEAELIRKRVATLIREMDPSTLARVVAMGHAAQQRKLVLDANQSLAADAVIKLLRAAAEASGQTISSSLLRLLGKLSAHAESGLGRLREQADGGLRDSVERLLKDWELADPNPDSYTLVLDAMSRAAPVLQGEEGAQVGAAPGARRLLQMALEVGSWGPTVSKAVSDLVEAGEMAYVLKVAEGVAPESPVGARVWEHLTTPSQLRRLLGGSDVEEKALRSIVEKMGPLAIPTLLDALVESESRSVRRRVFDALAGMGEAVGAAVMERLDDPRWFVVRNLLALVQRLPRAPEGFSAAPFMDHSDPRVRREAFPLALQEPLLRDRALALGLEEADERLVRMALLEMGNAVPEELVSLLLNRVVGSSRSSELRVLGVRALRASTSPLALEALLQMCSSGRTLLGRLKLAPSSPEVAEAIRVLAAVWPADARAEEVLAVARRSGEAYLARAAEAGDGST